MEANFETDRFDLVNADRVQIPDYRFGHNERGKLNVWIESDDKGKRFLHQVVVPDNKFVLHTGVYTKKCYILREKSSGAYFFLDINDYGIWLFNDGFCGSENFSVGESLKIQQWLDKT